MTRMLCGLALAAALGCGAEVKKTEAELKSEQAAAQERADADEKAYQKQQRTKKQ